MIHPTLDKVHRRGIALIIALAVLTILAAGSVLVTAAGSRAVLSREMHALSVTANELLHAAEAPILHWLARESATIVLLPEVESSEVPILREVFEHAGVVIELRITAWDQEGMVPLELAKAGSPLRLALPEAALHQLDQVTIKKGASPGLDLFGDPFDPELRPVFPEPVDPETAQQNSDALGAHLATHGGRINVNTAPLPLLQQAMRTAGRGGLEIILANRSAGLSTSIASLGTNTPSTSTAPDSSVGLVSVSGSWSFRIDARVNTVSKSWWAVYQRTSAREARDTGGWQCVQRLVIHD